MNVPRSFCIAGTQSGCGKTSVTLGLLGAFAQRGLDVRPFKAGPDFIDPAHHSRALLLSGTTRLSHNLDTWMMPQAAVKQLFYEQAHHGDVAVLEGVMGLYDGFSAIEWIGSTADLAKLLGIPVILVVDASSMARSAAALVKGFVSFDPDVHIAGIIFNKVGSARHAQLLREAVQYALPAIPVLGTLARTEAIDLPSRHLGLIAGHETSKARYQALAEWTRKHIDLDKLLDCASCALPLQCKKKKQKTVACVRIAVARDAAFSFYYEENLSLLQEYGAELVVFSPLGDKELPQNIQGIYLGGGYPELYAEQLERNSEMRASIRAFSQNNGVVYAECGGFMYLLDALEATGNTTYAMCGVFKGTVVLGERFSALGYREICLTKNTILGTAGDTARGHEFHYSFLKNSLDEQKVYTVFGRNTGFGRNTVLGRNSDIGRNAEHFLEGYTVQKTLGSYIHLHFASRPELAKNFVMSCAEV